MRGKREWEGTGGGRGGNDAGGGYIFERNI